MLPEQKQSVLDSSIMPRKKRQSRPSTKQSSEDYIKYTLCIGTSYSTSNCASNSSHYEATLAETLDQG